MPDTVRNIATLQGMFPDNTTRVITPQMLRDFVVSSLNRIDDALLADKHYVHDQSAPLSVWTIVHGLGTFPSVTVVDSAGTVWLSEVSYPDANTVVVTHSAPFSGKAYLN